ncbi:hypothetical protein H131_03464 [Lysinibacillus sphaericus OT4b.31]|uniref:Uncharacterized protein n=1 Tax=Lysinibacillus sphaericus OT4b.31 TaxID=1285586 RepID=R7ZHY0_LYSSH|nr:hypothetical protein H131_03464 [Lysinibacillus sphaericus OT4b.31]
MMVDAVAHFGRIDILVKNAGVGDNIHVATNADDMVWQCIMDKRYRVDACYSPSLTSVYGKWWRNDCQYGHQSLV